LSTSKKPVPKKGWMRALLFLIVFTGIYLLGTALYNKTMLNKTIPPFYSAAAIFASAMLLTLPFFRIFIDKKPLATLGYRWKLAGNSSIDETTHSLISVAMAIAILGIGWLILYMSNHLEYHGAIVSPQNLTAGLIVMCVIAIAEESVFRGYLLANLLESFAAWPALLISALVFAFLHSGNPEAGILAVVNVFLAGIFLGLSYIHTRNLWFAILFHLSWNFIQGPILGFPVSGLELPALLQVTITGEELLTGGKFGFEASIIQTILFVIAIIILYYYYRNHLSTSTQAQFQPSVEKAEI
jgi:membrane protease YdiL (CAAX protease family)